VIARHELYECLSRAESEARFSRVSVASAPCDVCGRDKTHGGGWGVCLVCYRKLRRKVLKTAVVSLFGGVCGRCEQPYPVCCYDFHHVDSKIDKPSTMFAFNSIEKIADELAKCVMVCANCHRLAHEEIRDGA
jgi:hypothetical protein